MTNQLQQSPQEQPLDVADAWAGLCVHEIIERQCKSTPLATAIQFEDQQVTYRELDSRVSRLARRLRGLQLEAESVIGIYAQRGPSFVVGMLAIAKAAFSYLPLDPIFPPDRINFIVRDSGVRVVLADANLGLELPPGIDVIDLTSKGDINGSVLDWEPPTPEHLVYVLYTSGSTGLPKGVEITHKGLVNLLDSMRAELNLSASDFFLSITTPSFDIAMLEYFLPLCIGATLVIAPASACGDPERLEELITAHNVSAMQATPATWHLLLEAGWIGFAGLKAICGGEAMTPALAEQLLSRVACLWNAYGPTETTIWSTLFRVRTALSPIAIGRPIANTDVYILDDDMIPTEVGSPGELYIAGHGLARGYRNRPNLTSERFVYWTFEDRKPVRVYRTGDYVRQHSTGDLEFLGRTDQQVKIRGHRVELGEVEATLSRYPGLARVAVQPEGEGIEKQLIAYVSPKPHHLFNEASLRAFARTWLPHYMVPNSFIIADEMPLTLNGKIDRSKLKRSPLPKVCSRHDSTMGVSSRIANLFGQVLGRWVAAADDFFAIGGSSPSAARATALIGEYLHKRPTLRQFLDARTANQLAVLLETLPTTLNYQDGDAIPEPTSSKCTALSHQQQRLWFLSLVPSIGSAYYLAFGLTIDGPSSTAEIEKALTLLIDRQPALRSFFTVEVGKPIQRVVDGVPVPLNAIDLQHQSDADRAAVMSRHLEDLIQAPFTLSQPPLIRFQAFKIDSKTHVLYVVVHHIVFDELSKVVFQRELIPVLGSM